MAVLALVGVVIWFALNALLWYVRPTETLWLLGSAGLCIVFFSTFLWYLALRDKSTKL